MSETAHRIVDTPYETELIRRAPEKEVETRMMFWLIHDRAGQWPCKGDACSLCVRAREIESEGNER